jgi:hypothetical protein
VRVLVVVTPRAVPPPELVPGMLDATIAWHDRNERSFETFGTFIGGGGFGVLDGDEIEVNRVMTEMPFTAFSDVVIRPCIAGTQGLAQARDAMLAMASTR